MVINKVLDEVFSRWSNLAVLRALNKYGIGISGREVARIAGITVKNCFNALTDFENLGIVNRVRGGRDHLFTLNRDHFLVKEGIIPLFDVEDKFAEAIFDDIKKKLKKKCNSVYVFGSVVLKEEDVDSDLDLCVIYDKASEKESLEDTMYELQTLLRKKYSVNASPFYVTTAQFSVKAKSNKPPVADVIKEGKLLFGNSIKALLNAKRS
ncbi:MAG: nucleotidyltransferase domain-containing protein [Melioribacteraceae bacterium]